MNRFFAQGIERGGGNMGSAIGNGYSQSQSPTKSKVDWWLFFSIIPIMGAGMVAMNSFLGEGNFVGRQLIWACVALLIMIIAARVDFRFLRRTGIVISIYAASILLLLSVFAFGHAAKGAKSWISLGGFSIQPADFAKVALIILLAKYFSRRHVEIKHIRHILVSGVYALIPFMLVALQPDFGSAITIFLIWFGMVLVSGISKKHLALVIGTAVVAFVLLWNFGFKEYQKHRIVNFIHPLADVRGSGYNAYQSVIAVGSGGIIGKGVGYGTQSRLSFLPEYETDFIFAAFAEEWGFVGVIILLILFGIVFSRIFSVARKGETNFEILFALGVAVLFMSHLTVNIGMNIGLMPVTGIPVPFMSYGGSHLLAECIAMGILMGMRGYGRPIHRDGIKNEFLGVE
jgi:rod shape determining protein RodA